MEVSNIVAFVTGGASGLGEATVRRFAAKGARVAILDMNEENGNKLVQELGANTVFIKADVSSETDVQEAVNQVVGKFGYINLVVNCAGIGNPQKVLSKKGPHSLAYFTKVLQVNLIGTFNVIRLTTEKMVTNTPQADGERGVIICTASVAAYEGQIGQAAYSASKGGIVGMTLPIARELASYGIRNVTIAPGLFKTPLVGTLSDEVVEALGKSVPFPARFGKPEEYAQMIDSIVTIPMLNGTTIRLDGAIRMQPK